MSFDGIAPHYRWMEQVLAGGKLHRCRIAFLNDLGPIRSALLAGEGHGRFLEELLRAQPQAQVTCVDSSNVMLERTRQRLTARQVDLSSVAFVHADILAWRPQPGIFDLIATNFFLDCFPPGPLAQVTTLLAESASPYATWLLGDFQLPERGVKRLRAWLILKSMYWFFAAVTKLPAHRITKPDSFLVAHGFQLIERRTFEWGLLHADLWRREALNGHRSRSSNQRFRPAPELG